MSRTRHFPLESDPPPPDEPVILFAENLDVEVTGAGFQLVATVPIAAGLLESGVLRFAISGRRTTGSGASQQRIRIGGSDLLTPAAGDTNATIYVRGCASAPHGTPDTLRANAVTSRGGIVQLTGLASVDLSQPLDLTFEIDLATDSDVFTFDELTVEYLAEA